MAKILELPVESITPNDYNVNEMPSYLYRVLVNAVKKDGRVRGVVLVRPADLDDPNCKEYVLVDGENRWRAGCEAGLDTIRAEVLYINRETAVPISLAMNKIRGNEDDTKFAVLLEEMLNKYDVQEIIEQTGYTLPELEAVRDFIPIEGLTIMPKPISPDNIISQLGDYKDADELQVSPESLAGQVLQLPIRISFRLNYSQRQILKNAITIVKALLGETRITDERALEFILAQFVEDNKELLEPQESVAAES